MPEMQDLPMSAAASLPPSEAERKQARLAALAYEDEGSRSERRAKELQAATDAHLEIVARSHENHPTRAGVDWGDMDPDEQRRWNDKRRDIDMANRAYHREVVRVCAEHHEENAHLAKLRAEAAAKTA